MSCLGVHFALTEDEVKRLCAMEDEQERLTYIVEDLEERYLTKPATYAAQSDKAWDAMHRTLSDGYLTWNGWSVSAQPRHSCREASLYG